MAFVFLFPGQGSQTPRMGLELYRESAAARRVMDAADEILEESLGHRLTTLIFEGRRAEVEATENLQPAITVVSAACLAALRDRGVEPAVAAGHSLGEYTALHAAGALDLRVLLRLVTLRGRLMAEAARQRPGGMLSLVGLPGEGPIEEIVEEAGVRGVICVANLNSPDQVVLSGEEAALERAAELARSAGVRRTVRLPVSGAWHSPLMEPAVEPFERALGDAPIHDARFDVYANVTARPVRRPGEIRDALVGQICGPVRWSESVRTMLADHPDATWLEVGPGRVLKGLALRIDRRLRVTGVSDPASLEKVG